MKVLKGILVDHTKKENEYAETRFYVTKEDEVAKGDIFSVWAHGRLTYFKVKKVFAKYEYLASENDGVAIEDVMPVLNKLDTKSYNVFKFVLKKTKRLTACLEERVIDGKKQRELSDTIAALKGSAKAEVKAILDDLKALEEDPEAVMDAEQD